MWITGHLSAQYEKNNRTTAELIVDWETKREIVGELAQKWPEVNPPFTGLVLYICSPNRGAFSAHLGAEVRLEVQPRPYRYGKKIGINMWTLDLAETK